MDLRPSLLVLLAISVGCAPSKKVDPLAGNYVAWGFMDGKPFAMDGSNRTTQKLELKSDGSYTLILETSAMMILSAKANGTYTRTGNTLNLKGTMTSHMDDGYKKGTTTVPNAMKLEVRGETLETSGAGDDSLFFRKEGAGPPTLPAKLQLKPSEPGAIDLVTKVERAYASLKSLAVTGTVRSKGGGFVAKDAKFRLLFSAPSKFRFESTIYGGTKEINHVEITWDGGEKCWWYTTEFGETTDRPLSNALGIAAVNFGPGADVIPSLLLPKEMRSSGLSGRSPEATLLPNEKIGGRECAVLQLRGKDGTADKYWIDPSTHLILRTYEELREVTTTFDPHPNQIIDAKEFNFGHRKR